MAMITYPLNDVEYTAEDAELYNCTRTSGVYSGEDFSCTVSGTNNNVTIGEGVGWIRNSRFSGKVFANKAPVTLALDIADAANPRIDVVAVRFDAATNTTDLVIKKGTAAASPVMPEIVQTESVYELYLFSVYRETAATVITADNVTDLRLDANYCGLMGDAITSIDTSAINEQFSALLAKIKKELADLKIGKIDAYSREETLSPTTKTLLGLEGNAVPDDAFEAIAQGKANKPNLLDNWHFADPVNQRGQTEYVGAGYTIDRWYAQSSVSVLVKDGSVRVVSSKAAGVNGWFEYIPAEVVKQLRGKTINISALIDSFENKGNAYSVWVRFASANGAYIGEVKALISSEIVSAYSVVPDNAEQIRFGLRVDASTVVDGDYVDIKAMKLELGSTQTLAHQDENGNWVLNDAPPNKQMETLKCCMSKADSADEYANGNNYTSLGMTKIVTGSYVGTGTYGSSNPNSLTFESTPKVVLINDTTEDYWLYEMRAVYGINAAVSWRSGPSQYSCSNTWENNTLTWYNTSSSDFQLNSAGHTYKYLAIL